MFRIEIIGTDAPELSPGQQAVLHGCSAVVASRRHRLMLGDCSLPVIDVAPIREMIGQVREQLKSGNVAVLASGDPLFYGIAKTMLTHFSADQVRIHPALSALQLACARFKVPWDDLSLISLHGRPADGIAGRILGHSKVMLFTDTTNTPERIATLLLDALKNVGDEQRIPTIRMRVAENLGLDDERIQEGSLPQMAARSFSPLNMVLIEQSLFKQELCFGLSAEEIFHSRGLITKDEVRAASLHKLRLPRQGVLWDIGGGSGSVSLEAARLCPELTVYTIEKKAEEQENIRRNIRTFNAYNMHLVCGEAPDALQGLPAPDRIFIGGSGSYLETIIKVAAEHLKEQGRIVVNAVLKKTAQQAPEYLQNCGFQVESATLAVTRKAYPQQQENAFNPITIISGHL